MKFEKGWGSKRKKKVDVVVDNKFLLVEFDFLPQGERAFFSFTLMTWKSYHRGRDLRRSARTHTHRAQDHSPPGRGRLLYMLGRSNEFFVGDGQDNASMAFSVIRKRRGVATKKENPYLVSSIIDREQRYTCP